LLRTTKLGFYLLMIAGVVVVVEGFSAVVFYLAEGRGFSYAEQASRRRALAGNGTGDRADDGAEGGATPELAAGGAAEREVLHPFLGFVFNPELNELEDREARGELLISRRGFFMTPAELEPSVDADLHVGVFGGSVAMLFCFQGRERLVAGLRELPALRGEEIAVHCRALGGYKQPQQLLTLGYLLALGEELDAVIAIDGFNELALSYFDNYRNRVTPHYPRGWKERVAEIPDPEARRLTGLAAFLGERRAVLARRFSGAPWRYSVTANLLWRLLDRWLARDLVAAQLARARHVPAAASYRWQGPFEPAAEDREVLAEAVETWRRSSLQMHRLCAANGVPYFHFLQPNQYDPGSKPMSPAEERRAVNPESPYRWPAAEGYPLLRAAGEELRRDGVRFHDLSGLFAEVEEPLYVDDCCHFNRKGNRLLADAVAEAIRGGAGPLSSGRP